MLYVFDTNSLSVLNSYFPDSMASFWDRLDEYVVRGQIISVREVLRELESGPTSDHLMDWIKRNKAIFLPATSEEGRRVREIFTVQHFRQLVAERQRLSGMPVADPFVIASAWVKNGSVVTEEKRKDGAAKIPNVCEHFGVRYTNLQGFLKSEGWKF